MDGIVVEGEYYVRASAQNVIHQKVSIKHGDAFVVSSRSGDLPRFPDLSAEDGRRAYRPEPGQGLSTEAPLLETGFYVGGTRHLSTLEIFVDGQTPIQLSSSLSDDDVQLVSVGTNPDVCDPDGAVTLPKDSILLARELTVEKGTLLERVDVRNYHIAPVEVEIEVVFDSDFRDIFEVRGFRRRARGDALPAQIDRDGATLHYRGLDGFVRRTLLRFSPPPDRIEEERAVWKLALAPGEDVALEIAARGGLAGTIEAPVAGARAATERVRHENDAWDRTTARFFSSNERLNAVLERASADTRLMCTRTPDGLVPYAGIPWYACPFGRDSLWTAMMTLSLQPRVAAGTLRFLARHQATERIDFVDAEPGKILHEMRTGEMANQREIPFIPYYGTVDATPLFLVLLDKYVRWTGDGDLLASLWEAARAALRWVREHGDLDHDGFLEYAKRSPLGLDNQGWKDSNDSVFHDDGTLARGPIALVEAQAYAWAALQAGARLARLRGEDGLARELDDAAEMLRRRFEEAYWSEALGTYVIALDGRKRPCKVVSSNAGHVLWAGLAAEDRAARVAESLLSPAMFSGWGIRTLADGQPRYNPISYHDGSVWPHDNAICAWGLKRYGFRAEAARVASAILDAAQLFDDNRVPELFCGFGRTPRHAPTPYPVACRPQAWSAATVFALLEAMLGLDVDGVQQRVILDHPSLPGWLDWIEIVDLQVGAKRANLRIERSPKGATLARSSGDAKIIVRD